MASTGGPVQPAGPSGPAGPVRRHRRGGFAGAIILIFLGLLFLAWNYRPDFNPWPVLWRYWPLILIFLGIGKIWDSYSNSHHPGDVPTSVGITVAWIALLVLFIIAVWHGGRSRWSDYDGRPYSGWGWNGGRWNWDRRAWGPPGHDTQSVDAQGAKSVSADVNMPAGEIILSGGSSHLLDADFQYTSGYEKPNVTYEVSGGHGQLDVVQNSHGPEFGSRDDEWTLRFGNVPLDLKLNLGAGHNDIRLNGMSVSHLEIHIGAGQLDLDLTGEQNNRMQTDIEGGVGQASIRIPQGQCVRAEASGGIGSISAPGMQRQDGAYVSAACKSGAPEMDMTVHGGIGQINLESE